VRAVYSGRGGFPGGVRQCSESDATQPYALSEAQARDERKRQWSSLKSGAGLRAVRDWPDAKGPKALEEEIVECSEDMADKKPTTETDRALRHLRDLIAALDRPLIQSHRLPRVSQRRNSLNRPHRFRSSRSTVNASG